MKKNEVMEKGEALCVQLPPGNHVKGPLRPASLTGRKREVFEREMLEHIESLYNAAVRLSGSESDAEDLVQETYYKAYRFFDQARDVSTFKAWLFQILRNTYINTYRKNLKEFETVEIEKIEDVSDEIVDDRFLVPHVNVRAVDLQQELHDEVAAALGKIADEYKMCIILRDMEGFSYKEISEITGDPIGTVMSRLHRARKMLQELLHDYAKEHGYASEPEKSDS